MIIPSKVDECFNQSMPGSKADMAIPALNESCGGIILSPCQVILDILYSLGK